MKIRLSRMHRESAIARVMAAVRLFFEANPGFKGEINVMVVSFKKSDFDELKGKYLEALLVEDLCLNVLTHEKVQASARKRVLQYYSMVKEISFNLSETYVYAHIKTVQSQ